MDLFVLFWWSFLAATILPLGSEPALAAVVSRRDAVAVPVTVATIGNYLGACTTYVLARAATRSSGSGRGAARAARAAALVRKYGAPALLLSWIPLLGDCIVAAAGAARMPFAPFSLWTAAGKAARYVTLALLIDWSTR